MVPATPTITVGVRTGGGHRTVDIRLGDRW